MRYLRILLLSASLSALLSTVPIAFAQDTAPQDAPPQNSAPQVGPNANPPAVPDIAPLVDPETGPQDEGATTDGTPDIPMDTIIAPPLDGSGSLDGLMGAVTPKDTLTPDIPKAPDYSKLTEAEERLARLDALFVRLAAETDAETADLIAESIWAIWLDSGSDSVNLLLRRGTAAEKRSDYKLARRLYDHVTTLNPDYAEGWSRSARLAIVEEDLSRALSEVTKALILEDRHFYALWTMGNIFERIGKNDAAREAYVEAAKLYPELTAVKDRLRVLGGPDEGPIL